MIKYFKSLLDCLWEIEKDLHAIASSMKANENHVIDLTTNGDLEKNKEKTDKLLRFVNKLINKESF